MPTPSLDIGVLLADDHQLMREGLRRLLEAHSGLHIVAEAGNAHEALQALREQAVDVAVLDLSMPGMSGMDLIRRVKTDFPQVAVLVLTMHAEEQYAMRAFRCGAGTRAAWFSRRTGSSTSEQRNPTTGTTP